MADIKVPFSSSPTGRSLKTLAAGTIGYILLNLIPVIDTLPGHELLALIVGGLVSGVGRWAKSKGWDLGVI